MSAVRTRGRPRRPMSTDGKLLCQGPCGLWKFRADFRIKGGGTTPEYEPMCKVCQQTAENQAKSKDPAFAAIISRAKDRARRSGVPVGFFMADLNYESLIVPLRAIIENPDARCQNCHRGKTDGVFRETRDVQLEHIEPPRFPQDWARLHARNIRILCGSCNNTKSDTPFADWLDSEESKRLSAEAARAERIAADPFAAAYQPDMLF